MYAISGLRYRQPAKDLLLKQGIYSYDLRDWDEGEGFNIELSVLVNHFGTMFTNFPIPEIQKYHDYIENEEFYERYNPKAFSQSELDRYNIEL